MPSREHSFTFHTLHQAFKKLPALLVVGVLAAAAGWHIELHGP